MPETVTTLPDEETLRQRLQNVSDEPALQEGFYPLLLRLAGQQKYATGVVLSLRFAMDNYVEGMDPGVALALDVMAPRFIDALVENPQAAQEAKEIYRAASEASQKE